MTRLESYLYGNGGNIIMVQIENEYGVYHECDANYLIWLRDETIKHVGDKAVIFTTDIPNDRITCGKIPDVFATIDFGIDRAHEMDDLWKIQRSVQPKGPLVNSEFYPGWLTHWQEENQRRDGDLVADTLRRMLVAGASVNFYMFFGGTNFGFTAGANDWGVGLYKADLTSYDYDAPMDEAGDPTEKFRKIRAVIDELLPPKNPIAIPEIAPKMKLSDLVLQPVEALLSESGRASLGSKPVKSARPLSFEELDQFSGLVLYETTLPRLVIDPSQLTVNGLRDRAFVYIDQMFVGTLSRENAIKTLPINAGIGSRLQILVENQGRINFNVGNDTKGIFGDVTIQLYDGVLHKLADWDITGFPLEELNSFLSKSTNCNKRLIVNPRGLMTEGPVLYFTEFTIDKETKDIHDTYLDPTGWGKGVLYVNGFNLGRYWPLVGPQITVYVPKDLLKTGKNTIAMLEYQKSAAGGVVKFDDKAKLDGL